MGRCQMNFAQCHEISWFFLRRPWDFSTKKYSSKDSNGWDLFKAKILPCTYVQVLVKEILRKGGTESYWFDWFFACEHRQNVRILSFYKCLKSERTVERTKSPIFFEWLMVVLTKKRQSPSCEDTKRFSHFPSKLHWGNEIGWNSDYRY